MGNSQVFVICQNPACGKEFGKFLAEFNRSKKLERPHFCSLKCHAQYRGLSNFKGKVNRDTSHLRDIVRRDAFSPFRYHLRVMKKSAKRRNQECYVTLVDLKLLWEKQKGICPYTGWSLVLLPCTTSYETTSLTINRASVDRKDSSQGYTLDNIHFVAVIANYAKMAFTEEDLINFCHDVCKYRNLDVYNRKDLIEIKSNYQQLVLGNRRDEYSPFRQHLKLARRRVKSHGRECTITLEYLKALWEQQNGICSYTGWKLDNPETTAHWENNQLHPKRASLDRIDSSLGYVLGNVQFVSVMANFAKRDFQEEELLKFFQAVVNYRVKNTPPNPPLTKGRARVG
ncbi:hypothetical protein [Iningainema tapete]|uniref:Uncharacterized protein n=1 Tax=Iningainema tapete BLCC-T55 TaxID=2748662 RepID=A0A8J7C6C6_9CYAN|nr:hypothetical protein [Iningainema tapete]MBD2771841.1 hypothetical protein [Iningainema tapete BLCC-T55]